MPIDPTYQTKNYEQEGGNAWVIGGTLEIANGGTLILDAGSTFEQGAVPSSGITRGAQHAVTGGEVTATSVVLATGLTTLAAMFVMILRAGKVVTADAGVAFAGGNITLTAGAATYVLTAADVVNWIAVGS
jgi:hypothetical protein